VQDKFRRKILIIKAIKVKIRLFEEGFGTVERIFLKNGAIRLQSPWTFPIVRYSK
jgi:hypothetical protein